MPGVSPPQADTSTPPKKMVLWGTHEILGMMVEPLEVGRWKVQAKYPSLVPDLQRCEQATTYSQYSLYHALPQPWWTDNRPLPLKRMSQNTKLPKLILPGVQENKWQKQISSH